MDWSFLSAVGSCTTAVLVYIQLMRFKPFLTAEVLDITEHEIHSPAIDKLRKEGYRKLEITIRGGEMNLHFTQLKINNGKIGDMPFFSFDGSPNIEIGCSHSSEDLNIYYQKGTCRSLCFLFKPVNKNKAVKLSLKSGFLFSISTVFFC